MGNSSLRIVLAVTVAACGAPRDGSAPASVVRAEAAIGTASAGSGDATAVPVAVVLDVDVYGADGGRPIAHVGRGHVVARSDGTTRILTTAGIIEGPRVRIRTPDGVVDGWIDLVKDRPRRGLGLFATRDVPVMSHGGAVLGALQRGAFVPVSGTTDGRARIWLPPYGVPGVVPADALGTSTDTVPTEPATGDLVENRRVYLETAAGRVATKCTVPVAVGAMRGDGVEVAQTIAGVTLRGVAREDAGPCRPRIVHRPSAAVPAGWSVPSTTPMTLLARPRELFRLQADSTPPQCVPWRFQPAPTPTITTAVGRRDPFAGEIRTTTVYTVEGASPRMQAPTWLTLDVMSSATRERDGSEPRGLGEGWGGGAWQVVVVAETEEGLLVLDHLDAVDMHELDPEAARSVVAFHPDDVDVWYTRREVCARDAKRVPADLRSRLLAGSRRAGRG